MMLSPIQGIGDHWGVNNETLDDSSVGQGSSWFDLLHCCLRIKAGLPLALLQKTIRETYICLEAFMLHAYFQSKHCAAGDSYIVPRPPAPSKFLRVLKNVL